MTNSSSNSANCATERLDCCCSKTPFASLSPSSSQQPQPQQSQYVADIVLSLVKDGRYHTTLVGIIIDAIEPWINPRVSNGLFTVMRPEIELLASFIHWIVVQWRMGRSLGMEYVGLTYGRNANMRRIDKSGILPAVSAGYESCPTIEKQEKSGIHSPAEMPSLPLLLGVSRTRATTYVLLHTLLPYLVRRAMRGGWEELSFIGKCFNRTGAVCNVESLRGEARLRVHEERRNRMISRSSSSMVMTSNGTSFDNQGVDHAGYDNQLVMNSLFPRRCYRQIMHRYVRGLWNILQVRVDSVVVVKRMWC